MNCKPGDLAIFVRSNAGNEGLVVTCVRLATRFELDKFWFEVSDGPVWLIDEPVKMFPSGRYSPLAKDRYLRPIRPQSDDAVDEMTLLAGKPEGVTA